MPRNLVFWYPLDFTFWVYRVHWFLYFPKFLALISFPLYPSTRYLPLFLYRPNIHIPNQYCLLEGLGVCVERKLIILLASGHRCILYLLSYRIQVSSKILMYLILTHLQNTGKLQDTDVSYPYSVTEYKWASGHWCILFLLSHRIQVSFKTPIHHIFTQLQNTSKLQDTNVSYPYPVREYM